MDETRRGVVLVLYAEGVAAALAVLMGLGAGSGIAVIAFLVLLVLAGGAFTFLWLGRHEPESPGPRWVAASAAFTGLTVLGLALVSASLTTTIHETGRVGDLRAALVLLPAVPVGVALGLAALLWPRAGRTDRTLLGLHVTGSATAAGLLVAHAMRVVDDLVLRFGDELDPRGDASQAVLEAFFGEVRVMWAVVAVATRCVALLLLYRALGMFDDERDERFTPSARS